MINAKVMIFDNKLIVRVYPYDLTEKVEKGVYEPSDEDLKKTYDILDMAKNSPRWLKNVIKDDIKKRRLYLGKETSINKKKINNYNKLKNLLGLGMCNEWQYFLTITLDKDKVNRYSIDSMIKAVGNEFHKMRKRGIVVEYLYIIERHKDGAYHGHGFINIPSECIDPSYRYRKKDGTYVKPSKSNYVQWGIKQDFFDLGICVVSPIQSKIEVINYCSKYIEKNLALRDKHGKSIFHSHGLKSYVIVYGASELFNISNPKHNLILGKYAERNQIEIFDNMKDWNFKNFNKYYEYSIDLN